MKKGLRQDFAQKIIAGLDAKKGDLQRFPDEEGIETHLIEVWCGWVHDRPTAFP